MIARILLPYVLLAWLANTSHAVQPDEVLDDPLLEQQARSLSTQIRCLVCQSESIDESQAPIARDLRILIRSRLKEGESPDDIALWLQQRYGHFIFLDPPWQPSTYFLWLSPFFLLLCAVLWVVRYFIRQQHNTQEQR